MDCSQGSDVRYPAEDLELQELMEVKADFPATLSISWKLFDIDFILVIPKPCSRHFINCLCHSLFFDCGPTTTPRAMCGRNDELVLAAAL